MLPCAHRRPFVTSWLAAKKDWPALAEALGRLVDRYMEGALEFKRLNCRELVPTDRLSCVRTFTRLMDAVTTAESGLTPDLAPEALAGRLEPWFQFCLVWGLGGPLDEAGRKKFDGFMRWAALVAALGRHLQQLLHRTNPAALTAALTTPLAAAPRAGTSTPSCLVAGRPSLSTLWTPRQATGPRGRPSFRAPSSRRRTCPPSG